MRRFGRMFGWMAFVLLAATIRAEPEAPLVLGGSGDHCGEDPHCINRLHPAIPMVARSKPGRTIVMHTRNAGDLLLDPDSGGTDTRPRRPPGSKVHPMIGPVHIEGAKRGDVLAVTLLAIEPGASGYSVITPSGWVADGFPDREVVFWRMDANGAVSDAIPGVRIPDGSFPGVVTVLPGVEEHRRMLARETALSEAGGNVASPEPINAAPDVCGPDGKHAQECLRTFPPREHGGNMDIRYIGRGATVYLPCYIDGCGLAVGDLHYAQGDGEVAGTAIEMDATVTLTTRLIPRDAQRPDGALERGPHYEGPSRLLDIPSRRFYATTGFPFKQAGDVPPQMAYLESSKAAGLENLSNDLNLAVRNALLEMIDYISATYGLTREQAYIVATVAVDIRVGQLVDSPNVGATAVLPLDIFEK